MNERSFFSRSRRRGRNAINVLLRPVCHFSSLRTIIERRALSVPCLTVRRTPRVAAVTALRRIQRRCLRRARSDRTLRPGRTVRARAFSPRVPVPISDETRGPRSNLSSSTNVSNRRGRPRGVEAPPDASARLAPNPSRPSRTIAAPPRARAFPDRQSPRLNPVLPIIPSTTKQVPRPRGQAGSTLPARAHPRWFQARPRPARPRRWAALPR